MKVRPRSISAIFEPIPLKPPGGGAPPPTHSWRICDRGLVLAGVLGVLGNLGILGKNLENIAPERSQIEPRGLKNRGRGLQNRARSPPRRHFFNTSILRRLNKIPFSDFFGFWANLAPSWRPKTLRNRGQNPKKSMLRNNTFLGSIL